MGSVLVLLPHNDDEFFLAPLLEEWKNSNDTVFIAYLSYGSIYGVSNGVRKKESEKFLSKYSIRAENIIYPSEQLNVFDGHVIDELNSLYIFLIEKYKKIKLDKMIIPAWEGGHHDHDSVHVLGVAVALKCRIHDIYEFSIYNRWKTIGPLFNVMKIIKRNKIWEVKIKKIQALKYIYRIFIFRSQLKTFLGLFPGIVYAYLIKGRIELNRVEKYNYLSPPHGGQLLYERRFKIPYEYLRNSISNFILSADIAEMLPDKTDK